MKKEVIYGSIPAPKWFLDEFNPTFRGKEEWSEYFLETSLGGLKVTFFQNWIATRFDDEKRAFQRVNCNRFSGKWNFLGDSYVESFKSSLIKIL